MSQAQAVTLTNATADAVKAFAKARKISSAACLEAAALALSMQAAMTPARATRQAGQQSIDFRNAVVEKIDTLKGRKLTFAEVARDFNIDPANAVNNLKWLKEHGKINFIEAGKGVKPQGQRGRAPTLIEFV
ncbi:hypothetical protein D3C87_325060 [compost metagenome]